MRVAGSTTNRPSAAPGLCIPADFPICDRAPAFPSIDAGSPDARSGWRFLWWLIAGQPGRCIACVIWAILTFLTFLVLPYLLQSIINRGLERRDFAAFGLGVGLVATMGLISSAVTYFRHRAVTFVRTDSALRTMTVVIAKSTELGSTLKRRVAAGEVVSVGSVDVNHVAQCLSYLGNTTAGVMGFVLVLGFLFSIAWQLGVVAAIGFPLTVAALFPQLRWMERELAHYRSQTATLTGRSGDIVAGLGVLNGIGGKTVFARHYKAMSSQVRDQGYKVSSAVSMVKATGMAIPALLIAVVTWISAHLVMSGRITIGEFAATYAFMGVLVFPLWSILQSLQYLSLGLVSARRITQLLRIEPEIIDTATTSAPITSRARNLSGGQQQRVRLARALATGAEVLILVEPTSAVDATTEVVIAQRLADYRRGKTTVVVTSSPAFLERADCVHLLCDGVLTRTGSHSELLADHRYFNVVNRDG